MTDRGAIRKRGPRLRPKVVLAKPSRLLLSALYAPQLAPDLQRRHAL